MYQAKKNKTFNLAIFLCLLYIIIKLYISTKAINPEISCHYSTQNDALPSVEDPNFSPGYKPIFFHETSCRGGINNRQACVIESAARLHPKRQINLLFSAPITESGLNNSNLVHLLKIKNIKMFRLHIEKYAEGTVVESIFRTQIKKSTHPVEHMADILRIVTLNKFGGVYLDTDSFLVKNLDFLPPNWIAKEYNSSISSGAMGFSVDGLGRNLTATILKEVHDTYHPKCWAKNGPEAIERVLNRTCPKVVRKSGDCKVFTPTPNKEQTDTKKLITDLGLEAINFSTGLKIYPPGNFYPVHYKYSWLYFKRGYYLHVMFKTYMHHMWNHLTVNMKIEKYSPYANLAKKHCPIIFGTYGNDFGQ